MANINVSVVHSLELVPIDRLHSFGEIKAGAIVRLRRPADSSCAIPGSIQIAAETQGDTVKTTITYRRRSLDRTTADLLEQYRATHLVALYIDETGARRVCGSPACPLSFSYTSGDGVFSCRLSGEMPAPSPFLIE